MAKQDTIVVVTIDQVVIFPETQVLVYVSDAKTVRVFKEHANNEEPLAVSMGNARYESAGFTTPHSIGCIVEAQILQTNSNGSIYVIIKAKERIRLGSVVQNIPYLVYTYEMLPDHVSKEHKSFKNGEITNLKNKLLEWSHDVIEDSVERNLFNNHLSTLRKIVNYSCMNLVESPKLRQSLLENLSLFERVHILSVLLDEKSAEFHDEYFEKVFTEFKEMDKTNASIH